MEFVDDTFMDPADPRFEPARPRTGIRCRMPCLGYADLNMTGRMPKNCFAWRYPEDDKADRERDVEVVRPYRKAAPGDVSLRVRRPPKRGRDQED